MILLMTMKRRREDGPHRGCFQNKVGPSNVPLEGYHCPRVVLVQKATVLIRQLGPVSRNLVPVPLTALDFHLQLRTLSYQSHPIRMANPPLVFKPIGNSRSNKGLTAKEKPHQQPTEWTKRYLTLVLVQLGQVIFQATPPGLRVPMQQNLYKNTHWT